MVFVRASHEAGSVSRSPWRAIALIGGIVSTTCNPRTPAEHDAVIRWLECEECDRGQLDSVVALGEGVVPALTDYLQNGPPPDRVDRLVGHLRASHAAVDSYYVSHDSISDSSQFVGRYLSNYVATFQSRSARALGLIGGPGAKTALDSALHLRVRSDVRDQIRFALDSLWEP